MANDPILGFYDDLADSFHLVHADWHSSVQRQGAQLAGIIRSAAGTPHAVFSLDPRELVAGTGGEVAPVCKRPA